MNNLVPIFWALSALGVIVFVHELGHFLGARLTGTAVHTFAVFPWYKKPLVCFYWGETRYVLGWIPFGGFVRLVSGNDVATLDDAERSRLRERAPAHAAMLNDESRWLENQSPGKRLIVLALGPAFSLLFGFVVLATLYGYAGERSPVPILGEEPTIVQAVAVQSPAEKAGIVAGDRIFALNKQRPRNGRIYEKLVANLTELSHVMVVRDGETLSFDYKEDPIPVLPGSLGLAIEEFEPTYKPLSPVAALARAGDLCLGQALLAPLTPFILLYMVVTTGGQAMNEVAGPFGILDLVRESYFQGWYALIWLTGFLSAAIGGLNMCPLPVFDGGGMVAATVEMVRGRPIEAPRLRAVGVFATALLIMSVLVKDLFTLLRQLF